MVKIRAAVISLSETWLDESVFDNKILISDYCLLRPGPNRNGGVECIYIHNNISIVHIHDLG